VDDPVEEVVAKPMGSAVLPPDAPASKPAEAAAPLADVAADEDTGDDAEGGADAEQPEADEKPKRGRGRPRKTPEEKPIPAPKVNGEKGLILIINAVGVSRDGAASRDL